MCFAPQRRALFPTSEPPKVARTGGVLYIEMCFAPQRRALFRHRNFQKWSVNVVLCTFWLGNVLRATTAPFSTSQLPKVVGPGVFCTFDLEMCFAPQRRALFRHLNFQKWSGPGVFCTFWLQIVLRATTACTFFNISTSKSGPTMVCFVHFDLEMCFAPQRRALFISHLPRCLRTAALVSLLFNPPEPQNHKKNSVSRLSYLFRAPASSFFWSFLFWLFSLLTAFSSLHIVGSLTSKLPSIIVITATISEKKHKIIQNPLYPLVN